jgi:hypothetical protein
MDSGPAPEPAIGPVAVVVVRLPQRVEAPAATRVGAAPGDVEPVALVAVDVVVDQLWCCSQAGRPAARPHCHAGARHDATSRARRCSSHLPAGRATAAALRAVLDLIPVALPLFAPDKRPPAPGADLTGQLGLLFHVSGVWWMSVGMGDHPSGGSAHLTSVCEKSSPVNSSGTCSPTAKA